VLRGGRLLSLRGGRLLSQRPSTVADSTNAASLVIPRCSQRVTVPARSCLHSTDAAGKAPSSGSMRLGEIYFHPSVHRDMMG
jgi:hypothetical protein